MLCPRDVNITFCVHWELGTEHLEFKIYLCIRLPAELSFQLLPFARYLVCGSLSGRLGPTPPSTAVRVSMIVPLSSHRSVLVLDFAPNHWLSKRNIRSWTL